MGDRDENPAKKPRKEENEDQVENTSAPEEQKQSLAVEVKKEHSVQSRGELIFTLNAMKYREIQLQCKDYGLAATGNKEALRDRLLSYLLQFREADAADTDENHPEGGAAPSEGITNEQGSSKTDVTMQDERKETETMIEKEEETYMVVDTQEFSSNADKKETPADAKAFKEAEPARVSYASENNMEVDPVDLNEGTDKELMEVEGPAVKSSPGKVHDGVIKAVGVEKQAVSKSPLRAFVKDAVNHMTDSSQKAKLISQISTPGDHLSPPPSDFTTSTASSKISGTKVREIVSKLSSHSGQSSSALSGKLQASKDARMARLAEMRGKVGCFQHQ